MKILRSLIIPKPVPYVKKSPARFPSPSTPAGGIQVLVTTPVHLSPNTATILTSIEGKSANSTSLTLTFPAIRKLESEGKTRITKNHKKREALGEGGKRGREKREREQREAKKSHCPGSGVSGVRSAILSCGRGRQRKRAEPDGVWAGAGLKRGHGGEGLGVCVREG